MQTHTHTHTHTHTLTVAGASIERANLLIRNTHSRTHTKTLIERAIRSISGFSIFPVTPPHADWRSRGSNQQQAGNAEH